MIETILGIMVPIFGFFIWRLILGVREMEKSFKEQRKIVEEEVKKYNRRYNAEYERITKRGTGATRQDDTFDNMIGYVVAHETGIPINFTTGSMLGMMTHESPSHHHDSSSSSSCDSGSSSE